MIKTGFESLDNLIDLNKAGLTVLTGIGFTDMLSGDIANNICLEQECDVLEVVSCKKEYLIKRLLINNAGVNYKKWAVKDQYTKQELGQIGQKTVDLIETTKRLPTIYEKAEYLEPKPRALTKNEIDNMIRILKTEYNKAYKETHWKAGVWLWNNQNYEYNGNSPTWFPKYKKLDENIKMPDYTKLNDT